MMRRNLARSALAIVAVCLTGATVEAGARLRNIQRQGYLTCGVAPGVAGFAEVDAQGRYRGLDVDICRALSAAIFGHPDQVRYVPALSVAAFRRSRNIDVVSRRLTWELGREAPLGLLFGPIMFYDGQGFLVSKTLGAGNGRQLSGAAICVAAGTPFEFNVGVYFRANSLELRRVLLDSPDRFDAIAEALATGRCSAYTADVSELGAIRSRMSRPADFDILTDQITKKPLAQLVRDDDAQFFDILRWTIFAVIDAEELGITSMNVDEMLKSENTDVQRLLGVAPGNGKALGLDEQWAYHVIKTLGNYGEMFERNVGNRSPIRLERGANKLWTAGGLMYSPPLR